MKTLNEIIEIIESGKTYKENQGKFDFQGAASNGTMFLTKEDTTSEWYNLRQYSSVKGFAKAVIRGRK